MNVSATSNLSLYAAPLTNQPSPVSQNKKGGDQDTGTPEAQRSAATENAGLPRRLNVTA
jgi:hypothetical protein